MAGNEDYTQALSDLQQQNLMSGFIATGQAQLIQNQTQAVQAVISNFNRQLQSAESQPLTTDQQIAELSANPDFQSAAKSLGDQVANLQATTTLLHQRKTQLEDIYGKATQALSMVGSPEANMLAKNLTAQLERKGRNLDSDEEALYNKLRYQTTAQDIILNKAKIDQLAVDEQNKKDFANVESAVTDSIYFKNIPPFNQRVFGNTTTGKKAMDTYQQNMNALISEIKQKFPNVDQNVILTAVHTQMQMFNKGIDVSQATPAQLGIGKQTAQPNMFGYTPNDYNLALNNARYFSEAWGNLSDSLKNAIKQYRTTGTVPTEDKTAPSYIDPKVLDTWNKRLDDFMVNSRILSTYYQPSQTGKGVVGFYDTHQVVIGNHKLTKPTQYGTDDIIRVRNINDLVNNVDFVYDPSFARRLDEWDRQQIEQAKQQSLFNKNGTFFDAAFSIPAMPPYYGMSVQQRESKK